MDKDATGQQEAMMDLQQQQQAALNSSQHYLMNSSRHSMVSLPGNLGEFSVGASVDRD